MRSIAARKAVLCSPVVTPRTSSAGRSRPRTVRTDGRAMAMNTTAPTERRSQAVPAGPAVAMRWVDKAEPTCTDNIAVTARVHGGGVGSRVTTTRAGGERSWLSRSLDAHHGDA